jgi:hypothetical protein
VIIIRSKQGVLIRLTQERWQHIVRRHPEIEGQKERVLETVASPDCIQRGDMGTLLGAKRYLQTPLTEKFLVVIYKELSSNDGFILTAYFTAELSTRRSIIWSR